MRLRLHIVNGCAAASIVILPAVRAILNISVWWYAVPLGVLICSGALQAMGRGIARPQTWLKRFIIASICLFGTLLTSAFWSIASPEKIVEDVTFVSYLSVLVLIGGLTLNHQAARVALRIVILASVVVSIYVILQYRAAGSLSGYGLPISEYYLVTGTLIGCGAVGSAALAFGQTPASLLWLVPAIVTLLGLSLALARGALVFSVLIILALGTYGVLIRRRRYRKVRSIVVSLVRRLVFVIVLGMLVAGTIWGALQVDRTAARLARMFSGSELDKGGRGALWRTSWENIAASPWVGHGLGSNGLLSAGDENLYPHNLFLQVWLDSGIIGVLFVLSALAIPVLATWFTRQIPGLVEAVWPYLGIYLLLLLEFQKSTDFYTARALFVAALLLIVVVENFRRSSGHGSTGVAAAATTNNHVRRTAQETFSGNRHERLTVAPRSNRP